MALQGVSGSTATVFIRWPYSLHTFDRVLRSVDNVYFTSSIIVGQRDGERSASSDPTDSIKEEKKVVGASLPVVG